MHALIPCAMFCRHSVKCAWTGARTACSSVDMGRASCAQTRSLSALSAAKLWTRKSFCLIEETPTHPSTNQQTHISGFYRQSCHYAGRPLSITTHNQKCIIIMCDRRGHFGLNVKWGYRHVMYRHKCTSSTLEQITTQKLALLQNDNPFL
jgi:hypothetical protein